MAEIREESMASLLAIIEDMVETLYHEARELERLVTQIEQQTGLRDAKSQLPLTVSQLADLHHRIKKLRGQVGTTE